MGIFRLGHLALFIIGISLFVYVMSGDPHGVRALTREDGLVENITALLYFVGAVACLIALYRGQFRLFAAIWLFLCVLFLGEETSWFQRQLDYSVPAVENMNTQGEFNLHNLHPWGGKEGIVAVFADEHGQFRIDIRKLLDAQTFFRIGFLIYFLLIPMIVMFRPVGRLADRLSYPRIEPGFLIAIWAVVIPSFILALITGPPVKNSITEFREMFFALVICLYTFGFLALERRRT